ncbi:MAG: leucine-rich repeat protein, partial [Clostridia bacterium]|nr:leucine-rich repeat protein [Clostridia bacterium]
MFNRKKHFFGRILLLGLIFAMIGTLIVPTAADSLSDWEFPEGWDGGTLSYASEPWRTTPRPEIELCAENITPEMAQLSSELYFNFQTMPPEFYLLSEEGIRGLSFWGNTTDAEMKYVKDKAAEIAEGCTTAYDKIYAVAKYMARNICYDYDYLTHNIKDWREVNLDPYDILKNESTICEGYSRTTAALLQILGVPCVFVDSPNHKWNMAHDGEHWILLDTTWMAHGRLEGGVLHKADTMSMRWFDFSLETANGNYNHLIERLPLHITGGVLSEFPNETTMADVTIPSAVHTISCRIIKSGSNIKTLRIPKTVTKIDSSCASGSLNKVYYEGTRQQFSKISIGSSNQAITGCRNIQYLDSAPTPYIKEQSQDCFGELSSEIVLSVKAGGADNITYQWYVNSSRSVIGGTPIPGAASAEYRLTPDTLGKHYYYAEVISTDLSVSGAKTSSVKSIPTEVHVFAEIPSEHGYAGDGIKYYFLSECKELIFEGNGIIDTGSYYPWHSAAVRIDAGITGIRLTDGYSSESRNTAAKFIVDPNNPVLMNDENGVLYDCVTKTLLAFPGNGGLKEFHVMDGTVTVSDSVFDSCWNIESIYFPASLVNVSYKNLERMRNVKTISVEEGNPVFCIDEQGALIDTKNGILLKYPSKNENIPASYIMSDSITSVYAGAFYGCTFNRIELSKNLVSIGDTAFWNCYNLGEIIIPKSVRSIGNEAFEYCYSMNDV